ncbi:interferon a3-like [Chiloscyllium plagiosum]|uniref:interferon a3-like n=1 Tax=Chiloscyllium plagiosum TaxID=36176 RepID=UPI001CB86947|nr:interferon a3-like [Chiloscyllium plagiosum]
MGFPGVWGLCSLFVLLPGILSQDCQRLQLQQVLNRDALKILTDMGGSFPLQCVATRESLQIDPLDLHQLVNRSQAQEKFQIVHQTLRHISKIYSRSLGSVTWSREKVENFRLLLERQLQELETCVRKPGAGSRQRRNSAILKYFKKLNKFLKQKKFSDCSWEIIRTETRARLQQLLFITGQLNKSN